MTETSKAFMGTVSFAFRYTPQTIELDHKLKPFIPDFIPAVGDIDAFLKVSLDKLTMPWFYKNNTLYYKFILFTASCLPYIFHMYLCLLEM